MNPQTLRIENAISGGRSAFLGSGDLQESTGQTRWKPSGSIGLTSSRRLLMKQECPAVPAVLVLEHRAGDAIRTSEKCRHETPPPICGDLLAGSVSR